MVGEEVGKRWPQMQQSGILNLLFLRLLTPAILSSPGGTHIPPRIPHTHNRTCTRTQLIECDVLPK
jgi:hypothetical protein